MGEGFGMPVPGAHNNAAHREPTKYLIIVESAGVMVARLLLASRRSVAEFDAGTEEVAVMIRGLQSERGASGAEWDAALSGHNAAERAAAEVYTLDV
jgi:hypothetical protein